MTPTSRADATTLRMLDAVQSGEWFHAGHLPDGVVSDPTPGQFGFAFFHVGSQAAALERISPAQNVGSSNEDWYRTASVYRVEILPGATVCPHLHRDDWADEDNEDGMNAGNEDFTGNQCGGTGLRGEPGYDVHPYANGYEDLGSLSLAVRPGLVRVVADLGGHPGWTD